MLTMSILNFSEKNFGLFDEFFLKLTWNLASWSLLPFIWHQVRQIWLQFKFFSSNSHYYGGGVDIWGHEKSQGRQANRGSIVGENSSCKEQRHLYSMHSTSVQYSATSNDDEWLRIELLSYLRGDIWSNNQKFQKKYIH